MAHAKGPFLPVVHIRIVCDQESKSYPCDFCHKAFASERSLNCHTSTEHETLDIQEVFVCSVCKCCLLSQCDLVEHIAMRHQLQLAETDNEDCKICEYCGMQLTSINHLMEHLKMGHSSEFHQRGGSSFNIVELTLTDISNIGVGDDKCKTLFRVIEIPFVRSAFHQQSESDLISSNEDSTINLKTSEQSKENSKCLDNRKCKVQAKTGKNNKPISDDARTTVNVIKEKPFKSKCEIEVSRNEIASNIDNQEGKNSEIEMTIKCESDELAASTMNGELILTVESKEKLIWSKDIMSQVISSSGILGRTKTCNEEPNVVVEKVQEDCCDTDQSVLVSVKREKEEKEEVIMELSVKGEKEQKEEVILQLSRNDDSWSQQRKSVAKDSDNILETFIVVNSDGRSEKWQLKGNGTGCQKRSQRRKVCCVCGDVFSNIEMLEKHEGSLHGVRIKCDLCDDTFAFSKSLRTHYMRKHDDARSFQCKICEKVFKSRSNLWSHHLTHDQNSRRFECSQCPQRFHSKSKLNDHLQSHSGKKKYQCGECDKGFLYPGLLLNHLEKHFSEARRDLPENESLYLVEVETEDAETA